MPDRAVKKRHFANSEPGVLKEITFVEKLFKAVAQLKTVYSIQSDSCYCNRAAQSRSGT